MSTLHQSRIVSARGALRKFIDIKNLGSCKLTETDYESDLSDLICDLCHLANHKGFSPSTILRRAESQYELEHDERQEAVMGATSREVIATGSTPCASSTRRTSVYRME